MNSDFLITQVPRERMFGRTSCTDKVTDKKAQLEKGIQKGFEFKGRYRDASQNT